MRDWLYPQDVEIVESKFSGRVKVVKSRGKYSVWVGGFEQSGPRVEKVWRKALSNLTIEQPACRRGRLSNVLILGLGCGTAASLLAKKCPGVNIVGVEIDPVMIGLGKRYFDLGEIPNLTILQRDAYSCINTLIREKRRFDLILVDLYFGGRDQVLSRKFGEKILRLCASGRQAIWNRLVLRGRHRGNNRLIYLHGPRTRTRRNRS